MPQRAAGFFWALLGLLAVSAILLAGLDPRRSAQRGPGWKRRMLTAGLLLLGIMAPGCKERPRDNGVIMCYQTVVQPPAQASMQRLSGQLTLLQEMAAAEKLQPDTIEQVLKTIEADIAMLSDESALNQLAPAERAEAQAFRDEAAAQVKAIRARLAGNESSALEATPEWRTITEAWHAMAQLAPAGSSTAQRKAAQKQMDEARAAIAKLQETDKLTSAEGGLLLSEADRLQSEMYRRPPKDDHSIMCYEMMYVSPAQQSFKRLSQRLPLLKSAVESGRLAPAAAEKVLGSIEMDVATLSIEQRINELPEDKRAEAIQARDEAEKLLKEIRPMLEKAK